MDLQAVQRIGRSFSGRRGPPEKSQHLLVILQPPSAPSKFQGLPKTAIGRGPGPRTIAQPQSHEADAANPCCRPNRRRASIYDR